MEDMNSSLVDRTDHTEFAAFDRHDLPWQVAQRRRIMHCATTWHQPLYVINMIIDWYSEYALRLRLKADFLFDQAIFPERMHTWKNDAIRTSIAIMA